MNSSQPSPHPSSQALRLGSFNVGRGFARKLPDILSRCLSLDLDVLALQETGDPALLLPHSVMPSHTLVTAPGPSPLEAGVALLIASRLVPRCRAYLRSKSGRLIGAVLELSKGQRTLLVSAYMPSGLDHRSSADPAVEQAHALYRELLTWTRDMQRVVVMGDLNETLTRLDRFDPRAAAAMHLPVAPLTAVAAAPSPIRCLEQQGFCDVYRSLFPDAATRPGYTHLIQTPQRDIRSRIDYIWALGFPRSALLHCSVDASAKLRCLSHHRLLWAHLQLAAPELHSPIEDAPLRLRLLNLRAASEHQRAKFASRLEHRLAQEQQQLESWACEGDAASLSALASTLTQHTLAAARASLPQVGAEPFRSKTVCVLQQQRKALGCLLQASRTLLQSGSPLARSPEWVQHYRTARDRFGLLWEANPFSREEATAWTDETLALLRSTRASISRECERMKRSMRSSFEVNRTAAVHRLLQSSALPDQILSVVDANGHLTRSAQELKEVMAAHFENVFALPPVDAAPLHPPPPAMLLAKPGIDPRWFDSLMQPVQESELLELLRDTPLASAPGEDQVPTGVWKLAMQGSPTARSLVCLLFNACLGSSTFPSCWKTGVIVPLVKDSSKERSMSNIRPITLQSCLGKLLNKLLAHRLAAILARHPILNPAQRGFVLGGTTVKCIDELLDAWQWSRGDGRGAQQRELYTLFYDIKQAYDSVQTDVLVRALQRLQLPASFVALVADSLTGLSSCVRTAFGYSRAFEVQRSIRQGDPLAPLLFVILLDALHDGLERNPFTGQQHGLRLKWPAQHTEVYLASLGYADDTNALTNTLADLRVQNDWVQYFMRFNRMRLNPLKCELVGRRADGSPLTAADAAAQGIAIDGHVLQPVPHDRPIRYLGVHVRFDGSWAEQCKKALAAISIYTRAAIKFHVPLSMAATMFNLFLLPKLELALHYVHGPGTSKWLSSCDRMLVGCLKHLAGSLLRLSHTAVALTLRLTLPSWLEPAVKVSELFLRLNSADPRWGTLGRIVMRHECGSEVVAGAAGLPWADSGTLMQRTARLADSKLQWELHMRSSHRDGGRSSHLLQCAPIAGEPSIAESHAMSSTRLGDGSRMPIAHDLWSGWGASLRPASAMRVFTDGSFDAESGTSAWSVVLCDRWLEGNFATIPADEQLVLPAHVADATLFGSSITPSCSSSVYAAELQAIARALAMLPLSLQLHIHTDSKASIHAVRSFLQQSNERKRMRMAARPLLTLVAHHLRLRQAAGGPVQLTHVAAHTRGVDLLSVGNRLADFQATRARARPTRSLPQGVQQLPITALEPHLHVRMQDRHGSPIIDDLRASARKQLRASAMERWCARPDSHSLLAGAGVVELGRAVLSAGPAALQHTLLHIATNSIHFYLGAHDQLLHELQCAQCSEALSVVHLAFCPSAPSVALRQQLHASVVQLLSASCEPARAWLQAHDRGDLVTLLRRLFPPSVEAAMDGTESLLARHVARCLVGAFSASEASWAAKLLSLPRPQPARDTFLGLRLRALTTIQAHFHTLKTQV